MDQLSMITMILSSFKIYQNQSIVVAGVFLTRLGQT